MEMMVVVMMTMGVVFFLFRQFYLHMLLLMGRQVHGDETRRSGWQGDGEGYQAHIYGLLAFLPPYTEGCSFLVDLRTMLNTDFLVFQVLGFRC